MSRSVATTARSFNISQTRPPVEQMPRINFIVSQVCKELRIEPSRMLGPQRSQAVLPSRCALAAALRTLTPLSLPQIGNVMRRDHSSVAHSLGHARNGFAVWI